MTENLLDDLPDQDDPNKDYLTELVGDGKKFATPQDLAKGKAESDRYIKTLERTQDELRADFLKLQDEYRTAASLKEIVDQLKPKLQNDNPPVNEDKRDPLTQFDPTQVESLVSSKYEQIRLQEKQEANYKLVQDKLKERYGNRYQDAVKQQIDNLGISATRLTEMARTEPQVLIRALGLDQPPRKDEFQAPPRSNQRSDNFVPSTNQRNYAYYEKMRKDKPTLYFDPKTIVQMDRDAIALREKFYD